MNRTRVVSSTLTKKKNIIGEGVQVIKTPRPRCINVTKI